MVLTARGERAVRDDVPDLLETVQWRVVDALTPDGYAAMVAGLRALRDALRPGATAGSG